MPLTADAVHLWRADLDCPPVPFAALAGTLSPDEHARAGRLRRPLDRSRFVAARGLLRLLLGESLGLPPGGLRFTYGPHGKPALAGDGVGDGTGLHFNLSHSDGQALFALSAGRGVGVDIERVRDDFPVASLAARYLPPPQAAALSVLLPAAQPAAFCRAWVRHEAVLKARGSGLAAPAPLDADPARWTLLDLELPPPYRAALAVEGPDVRVEWRDF